MAKTRTVPIRVFMNVEELWDCEIEVPVSIQNKEDILKYIKANQTDIDYECMRESWPGDITDIEID